VLSGVLGKYATVYIDDIRHGAETWSCTWNTWRRC